MNKKRVTTTFTRGTLGTEDVDHLVEMINVDNNKPHHLSATNPKKAAKKARQKQRKEDEKRQLEEEERLRLLEIEMQRRKLAEEQLQKSMRELNISNNKSKGRKGSKPEQNQNKNYKAGNVTTKGKNGNTEQKTFASKGVSCSLIGDSEGSVGFSTPWRTYMGWDSMDSVKENKSADYFTSSGMPVQRMGQMHINHVDQAIGVDILPHGFISSPVIYKEEKIGKIRRNASNSDKNSTVVSETETRTQRKKKRRKNKKDGGAESEPSNCISTSENDNSVRIQRINNILTRAGNGPRLNISEEGAQSLSSATAGADSRVTTSDSSKPEMVTIRRHPSISETTVTISIKNREGDEDILYTLLNGQVVRSQADVAGAGNCIQDENVSADGKKKSRRKRNRKKGVKKELEEPERSSYAAHGPPPHNRDFVTCTPIMNPPQPQEAFISEPNSPIAYTKIQQTNPVSVDHYYEHEMEIDLSKLRLPPGITITKVNQPTLSLGNHNKGEKTGNMVRICNTGILGPAASVSPNSEVQNNYNNPVFVDPAEKYEPGQDAQTCNSVSVAHHSAACNCNVREMTNQCHVKEDVFYGAGATTFKPWYQQTPESFMQSNKTNGCHPISANATTVEEPSASALGQHYPSNPFQVGSSHTMQHFHTEGRKVKMASFSHGHGLSEKSFKRKQPRPMYTSSKSDFSPSENKLNSDSDASSPNFSEGNSSYQAYALSLQNSLSQSQGRNPSGSISTNFLGNNPANGNFTFGSSCSKFSQAPPQVFCSDETR